MKILKNYILNENVKKRLRSRGLVYVNGDMREHVPPRITLEHVFPLFLLVYWSGMIWHLHHVLSEIFPAILSRIFSRASDEVFRLAFLRVTDLFETVFGWPRHRRAVKISRTRAHTVSVGSGNPSSRGKGALISPSWFPLRYEQLDVAAGGSPPPTAVTTVLNSALKGWRSPWFPSTWCYMHPPPYMVLHVYEMEEE